MKIFGETIDFKANLRFSLKRYRVWWIILIITAAFDFLTTLYFVEIHGVDREANVVVRFLIESLGLITGTLVGKILQLAAVTVIVGLSRRLGNVFLLVVIVLNCWAVVINSIL